LRLWRLTRRIHAEFDGEGARLFGGRWSPPGLPVVYTSGTASLAALEYFVHLTAAQSPDDLVLIPVDVPEGVAMVAMPSRELPDDWRGYPAPERLARIGAGWVQDGRAAVLQVPSVVIPQESNYLLNPAHPEFGRLTVGPPEEFSLDPRLWKPAGGHRAR
jgi:RES domain-containing protein